MENDGVGEGGGQRFLAMEDGEDSTGAWCSASHHTHVHILLECITRKVLVSSSLIPRLLPSICCTKNGGRA